jgi:hypothetical protein
MAAVECGSFLKLRRQGAIGPGVCYRFERLMPPNTGSDEIRNALTPLPLTGGLPRHSVLEQYRLQFHGGGPVGWAIARSDAQPLNPFAFRELLCPHIRPADR